MSTKPLITALDYNTIHNQVAAILGTGSGSRGYGQPIQSSEVTAGVSIINRDQWNNLRNDIISAKMHQTGVIPDIPTVSVGQPVGLSAGDAKVSYSISAQDIDTNRFSLGAGRFVLNRIATRSTTTSWSSSAELDITITFEDNNKSRYFFNAGGKYRITTRRAGGTVRPQNNSWTNLLLSAGARDFGGNTPQPINFYSLTNSPQIIYQVTASTPYSDNIYQILASANVPDNSTGLANEIYIKVLLIDGYDDPDGPTNLFGDTDTVDGELTIDLDEIKPFGTLFPQSLGNFQIDGPTSISVSSITLDQ